MAIDTGPSCASNHGAIREQEVRDIAARLGVADFVFVAPTVRKGSAQREPSGDGLLIVGERGAVLQVKSRDPQKAETDSEDRARSWVRKNAYKAMKQGLGTKRELTRRQRSGTPIIVTPVRATHLPADVRRKYECAVLHDLQDWPVIVIIDHPQIGEVDLGFVPGVVWFNLKDWSELQRRLRSTSATIEYVQRVLRDQHHVPLGHEAERYAAMRTADEEIVTGHSEVVPWLAHSDDFDELGTDLFHDILDRVWPPDGEIPWHSAEEYRSIVEFMDCIPPQVQSLVGRWFLRKRLEIANGRRISSGLVLLENRDRLVFACSHLSCWADLEGWQSEFTALAALRHSQALDTGAPDGTITLGVAVLVDGSASESGVQHSFVMLKGHQADLELPTGLRMSLERTYGVHNHRDRTTS